MQSSYAIVALATLLKLGSLQAFQVPTKQLLRDYSETENNNSASDNDNESDRRVSPAWDKCPKDDRFPASCDVIMPPFPTCMSGTLVEWIAYAQEDGLPNCCDVEDLSGCYCPIKNTQRFQEEIGYGCEQIKICGEILRGILATEQVKVDLANLKENTQSYYLNFYEHPLYTDL